MVRKTLKALLFLILFILPLLTIVFIRDFHTPSGGPFGKVIIEIEPGRSVQAVARALETKKIIRRSWTFLAAYRVFYPGRKLKAGEYEFSLPASPKNVLAILMRGKVYLHPFTVPEGLTAREISSLVRQSDDPITGSFLDACRNPDPIAPWDSEAKDLEGYLYPDTYHFPKNTPASTVAETMVGQFKKVFGDEGLRRAAELRMPVRKIVILASLIEKETSIPEERSLVSAVFYNRLRLGMKLDCDPTVIYALKQDDRYQGRLLSRDLKYPSLYNTYLFAGLPPGPICNPGRDSLQAALFPARQNFLYFVARDDGRHHFSRSYGEHLLAVKKYQLKKK